MVATLEHGGDRTSKTPIGDLTQPEAAARLDDDTSRCHTLSMPTQQPATTIRLNDDDKAILETLKKKTGLDSATAVIKLSIREALAARKKGGPNPLRIQSNGRTVEMNRYLEIEICKECCRELRAGLGNIQHTKDCTYRTDENDDALEGGEIA